MYKSIKNTHYYTEDKIRSYVIYKTKLIQEFNHQEIYWCDDRGTKFFKFRKLIEYVIGCLKKRRLHQSRIMKKIIIEIKFKSQVKDLEGISKHRPQETASEGEIWKIVVDSTRMMLNEINHIWLTSRDGYLIIFKHQINEYKI